MRTPNMFNILLRSANSENATTPQSCNFNLGSVLQNAPNLINFQNQSYCKIKVRHFTINATSAANQPLEDIGAVEIRINTPNPNTLQTASSSDSYQIVSSSLIGIVATGDTSFTRTNDFYDNDYFCSGNPFQGAINISYDNNPARVNDNSGKLNTNIVEYNLNGGYKY